MFTGSNGTAQLFLDGEHVGEVRYRGSSDSWSFGDFVPNDRFSRFAPIFGTWSLLMHADEHGEKLSPAAAEELRRAEFAIDRFKARLHWPTSNRWLPLLQVNIDGKLIEWKHG